MTCYFEKNKELLTMIKYYGCRDYAGCIFASNVVNNIASLEENVTSINTDVYNLTSMYQYIWILSFKKFVEEINEYKIDDDIKESNIKFV